MFRVAFPPPPPDGAHATARACRGAAAQAERRSNGAATPHDGSGRPTTGLLLPVEQVGLSWGCAVSVKGKGGAVRSRTSPFEWLLFASMTLKSLVTLAKKHSGFLCSDCVAQRRGPSHTCTPTTLRSHRSIAPKRTLASVSSFRSGCVGGVTYFCTHVSPYASNVAGWCRHPLPIVLHRWRIFTSPYATLASAGTAMARHMGSSTGSLDGGRGGASGDAPSVGAACGCSISPLPAPHPPPPPSAPPPRPAPPPAPTLHPCPVPPPVMPTHGCALPVPYCVW